MPGKWKGDEIFKQQNQSQVKVPPTAPPSLPPLLEGLSGLTSGGPPPPPLPLGPWSVQDRKNFLNYYYFVSKINIRIQKKKQPLKSIGFFCCFFFFNEKVFIKHSIKLDFSEIIPILYLI